MAGKPDVFLYILSGRSRRHLEEWFVDVPIGLSAEHGCFYRHPPKACEHLKQYSDIDSSEEMISDALPSRSPFAPSLSGDTAFPQAAQTDGLPNFESSIESQQQQNEQQSASEGQSRRAKDGWLALVDQVESSWRETVRPLFQHYTERTPGSFIEEKEVNLTWHYRNSDPEFGSWQAAELHVNLEKILNHMAVSVNKVLY